MVPYCNYHGVRPHGPQPLPAEVTRAALLLLVLAFAAGPAAAHPLPNLRYDRTVTVAATPAGLSVTYTLELSEWSLVFDGQKLFAPAELPELTGPRAYAAAYARKKAPLLAEDLRLTIDGRFTPLAPGPVTVEPDADHLKLAFTFTAAWPAGFALGKVAFADLTFDDRAGRSVVTLAPPAGVTLADAIEARDLHARPGFDYGPGDRDRARRVAATVTLPAAPPVPTATPAVTVEVGPPRSAWAELSERGVAALFDTGAGFGVMLLLCALFGAAHAFTPGHGKAMVAAYLVGERGTVAHAVALGLTTTIAHTGVVILVAAAARWVYGNAPPVAVQGWLALAGGVVIAGVGVWLLVQRLAGRADHVHLSAPSGTSPARQVWRRVVLLGLAGGAVPCGDAVLLLLVAANRGRLAAALPMLVAFSLGLAVVLVILGVGVVVAGRAAGRRAGGRWVRLLPVASAAVLVALGLWMVRDAGRQLAAVADSAGESR